MGVGEPALWGKPPYGGTRPMGEPAPNAVLEKAVMGEPALWGKPPPTRY